MQGKSITYDGNYRTNVLFCQEAWPQFRFLRKVGMSATISRRDWAWSDSKANKDSFCILRRGIESPGSLWKPPKGGWIGVHFSGLWALSWGF